MIWKAKYTKLDIKDGAMRTKNVFAWLPTYIKGEIVWMRSYPITQVYQISTYVVNNNGAKLEFNVGKWIDLDVNVK